MLPLCALLFFAGHVFAAQLPDNSATGIGTGFNNFFNKVEGLISTAIQTPDFVEYIDWLFLALSVNLAIFTIIKWVNNAAGTYDLITAGILIMLVKWLMLTFDTATAGIWQVGDGVGASLQNAMLGTKDLFFAPRFLAKLLSSLTWTNQNTVDLGLIFRNALNMFTVSLAAMVISMLAFVSAVWGFWGYSLSKLIGLLFVPTLVNEKISFLFDGWLRFFLGFVVYALVARLNLVLVVVSISLYFGLGLPPGMPTTAIEMQPVSTLFELLGLMTFMFVGILALFSTGRFAASIVSGAGGGGMGPAVLGIARMTARFAVR